jgi:Tol biopolymer transport system component
VAAGGAGEGIAAGIRTIGRNTAPAWSRGGERVAFLTELGTENYGRQSRGVTIWTPSSRQETLLVPSLAFISRLRWSPGDTRMLASGSDGVGRSGLYTVDPDTGAVEGLVRIHGGEPEGLEGEWLTNQDIAYIASDHSAILRSTSGNRAEEIIFQAPAGTKVRRLAADQAGEWIAFGLGAAEAPQEAWALHVEDGLQHRLMTVREGIISAISWSGDTVYVTTRGPAGAAIWRVSVGSEPVRTSLPAGDDEPSFSPDGRHLAYVENDRRAEVWALEGWLPDEAAMTRPRTEGAPKGPPSGP